MSTAPELDAKKGLRDYFPTPFLPADNPVSGGFCSSLIERNRNLYLHEKHRCWVCMSRPIGHGPFFVSLATPGQERAHVLLLTCVGITVIPFVPREHCEGMLCDRPDCPLL